MKTKSHVVFSARFGALLGMGVMMSAAVSAQTVDLVVVEKFSDYQQTDTAITQPWSNPYGFAVFVEGTNLSGITAPTFTSPGGSGTSGATLAFDDGDGEQWDYEVSFASLGALNTAFVDSLIDPYTVNVNGATVELVLSGSAFPNTPLATFNQGFWSGGIYYFDPTLDLVITSNVFTDYGANVDGLTNLALTSQTGPGYFQDVENFYSDAPSADSVEFTIAAFDVLSGQTLELELGFISIVSSDSDVLLPSALIGGVYSTYTFLQLQAIPEPSTYAMLLGGAGLAVAVWVRRRRR